MNANQLTKIHVEKLSDTLQFLIAENEIPLSDALKQVIDDVDAVCKKLLRDESAPAQPVIPEQAKPVAYTDNRNLKSLQKKGCATALLWLERNSEAGDIPLYTEVPAQPVSEPYKLAKSPEACAWISDGEGLWLGDCGLTWTFFDDGPNENGLKYCPSCGKKVSFIAAPAQESE